MRLRNATTISRYPAGRALCAASVLGLLFGPLVREARAQQIDVNPPLPNVMILLDTSGSMEKMVDGSDPEANAASTCSPGAASTPNRWGTAVQALTGDISPYYSCVSLPRASGSAFDNEYTINGHSPYDANYHIPFHRPVSGTTAATSCMYGPGKLPGASSPNGVGRSFPQASGGLATDFPADAISTRLYTPGVPPTVSCSFSQLSNGILDSARDLIRFGLMTFDTDPSGGIGVTTAGPLVPASGNPFDGMWSYYAGWDTGSASGHNGRPFACTTSTLMELGARNQAAPPWEGRLVPVPTDPNATILDVEGNNDNVQRAINAMRPYGATPIAGMMDDARTYLWDDAKGPQSLDPYVKGACRKEYIVLITDGSPNMDLRPSCTPEGPVPNGQCPYERAEDIAANLAGTSGLARGQKVTTYVIGFAVSQVKDGTTPVQCSSLVTAGSLSSVCSDPTKQTLYGPCCSLEKMAIAGGTKAAYFADTPGDLNKALGAIIAEIGGETTTRTVPAYAPSVADSTGTTGGTSSLFLASFVPVPGRPWTGSVQRQRYVCDSTFKVTSPAPTISAGDDFAEDLESHTGTKYPRRQFEVFMPAKAAVAGAKVNSSITLRPFVSSSVSDGVGPLGGTIIGPTDLSVVLSAMNDPDAFQITATSCPNTTNTEYLTPTSCKNLALNYSMAAATTDAMPDATFSPFLSRYDTPFGDIFHSTPVVVGPPSAIIRDESYQTFVSTYINRPTVLYTATNDGLLHAFDTSVATRENNEIWAFMPPAVMPKLLSSYPAAHQLLLDGPPVVKDAVWERTSAQLGDATRWHTMLVASFGSANRGFYAMDVTNPDHKVATAPGPQFRWQLTNMPAGNNELFGLHGTNPAITTLFFDPGDGLGAREIGVAVLPGGSDGSPTAAACARAAKSYSAAPDPALGYTPRDTVRCWGATGAPVAGRSVTIVRLDTGEIIRTFARLADAPAALRTASPSRVIDTALDSPMTGIPVVYPSTPGATAQRVFMGDADGTIWRFDVSNKDPRLWKGELFFDTVNAKVDNASGSFARGQPIAIAPVIALDRLGRVVLEVATGDQETFTTSGTNYVYSLTESTGLVGGVTVLRAVPNWYLQLVSGERVSGPMAVFDGNLYFATFAAAPANAICTQGNPKLWGRDFVNPMDATDLSKGGIATLQLDFSNPVLPAPPFITPPGFTGKIIPGVSINITPTCADTSAATTDPYIPGATHYLAQNVNPGTPSLFAQVGGKGGGTNAAQTFQVSIPPSRTPTSIDSWAAIVE